MEHLDALLEIRRSLHELSQPLAAATGMVELVMLELPESQACYQEIQIIDQQLAKIVEIVAAIRRIAADASQMAAPGRQSGAETMAGAQNREGKL